MHGGKDLLTSSRPEVLKGWHLDQQRQPRLGTCWKQSGSSLESEILGLESGNLCLNTPSRDCWCRLKFEAAALPLEILKSCNRTDFETGTSV